MTSPNDPAFARPASEISANPAECSTDQDGLTKREYFAALAMQGIMTNRPREMVDWAHGATSVGAWVADNAVSMADFLIERLNKKTDGTK